jgi:hypothetical protein
MRPTSIRLAVIAFVAVLSACQDTASDETVVLQGTAVAGPVCPVEREPPDPDCAERPVAGAEVVVLSVDRGAEVARLTTDASGAFSVTLAPGRYRLVAQPVDGLMAAPGPADVELVLGDPPEPVVLAYDTGIR